jgi:3-hydroxyacyl-CoA dehydrogenase/enoyl-CoA hydratase/3-hydroxybutyryl-CoA epimerase
LGSGISKISAGIDIAVRLKDWDMKSAGSGLRSCYDYFEQEFRKGNITRLEMEKRLNRISATSDYTGFRRADMVIEAVPEDLELKKKVLEEVESVTRDECLFASTAASLPIAQIAGRAKRPENVIRIHFFHPVESTLLVEVAVTSDTSPETVATALEFGKRLGKTAIVVKDKAGFYTTRILTPYFNEALTLLEEGATVDGIDTVMMEFGFAAGPLMLLDEMGVEEKAKDAELLYEAFGERLKTPSSLKSLIQDGRLGRKGKRGFYNYNGKNKVDSSVYKLFPIENNEEQLSKEEVQDRLSLAMVNEAVYCLEEGVIRNPRDGDVAAVLGLGFPAYLGGPFRYIDTVGARTILKKLENLSSNLGSCFNPAPLLNDLARQGKKFYTD